MKARKYLPIALLIALSATGRAAEPDPAPATEPSPPPPAPAQMGARHMDPAAMTERMNSKLGLSEEQRSAVEEINQRFAKRFDEQRQQHEAMRSAHHEAMRKLSDERDQELKKVLTEEQYGKLTDERKAMDARRREHRGHGPGMGPRPPAEPAAAPEAPAQ